MEQVVPILQLIKRIEENPKEMMGNSLITQLPHFLSGYRESVSMIGKRLEWPFCKFDSWMKEKYEIKMRWSNHLALYSENEEEGLKEIFKLLKEFLKVYTHECENHRQETEIETFNFYKLLYKIQLRPALYFGIDDIKSFRSYIEGILKARRDFNVEKTSQELEYEGFPNWLIFERHNLMKKIPWDKVYYVYPYARCSLDLFFYDYNTYLQEKYNKTLCE